MAQARGSAVARPPGPGRLRRELRAAPPLRLLRVPLLFARYASSDARIRHNRVDFPTRLHMGTIGPSRDMVSHHHRIDGFPAPTLGHLEGGESPDSVVGLLEV